jgi:UDP-hydrolysing UDP-N-acetyl-D-glucosamine 2-epimerase
MKKNKRKICVVTGTRAEYGILKSTMAAIKNAKNLELQILATGMHLSQNFGNTIKEIKKDGFNNIAKVAMTPTEDSRYAMAESIGRGIIGISSIFKRIRPDIVLVTGDRVEALAAAIAASCMGIVVAHIHGGDNASSGFDEYARHAITKLSNIHFPATKKSAERIIKMGENKQMVFIVGAPALDNMSKSRLVAIQKISKKYQLSLNEPIILVVQHPVTTEAKDSARQIQESLDALKELNQQTIIIYPNADAGGRAIIKVIEKYKKFSFIKIYKSISHEDYLSLMNIASVIVGNSSSGIIEAPSFCLPVVNIGLRQGGRERAKNIIDVNYKKEEIKMAIQKALYNKAFIKKVKRCKSPYDVDGKSGIKIAKILGGIKIDKKLIQKKLAY